MSEVPLALAADSWVDNPNVGNFNPGKKSGQSIFANKINCLMVDNRLSATKVDQAICIFLENRVPKLGKFVTQIPIIDDAVGDPTEWVNLLCEYGSIYMNLVQREAHKNFSNPVATVDPFPAAPFTVTTLDPANVDAKKKQFILGSIHKWSKN